MTGDGPHPLGVHVGRFPVCAMRPQIAAFRKALGVTESASSPEVPLTYPVRWLAQPEVSDAILQTLGEKAGLPLAGVLVHLEQKFAFLAPLRAEAPYLMDLYLDPAVPPETFALHAEISDAQGCCCRLQGRFAVIVPTQGRINA